MKKILFVLILVLVSYFNVYSQKNDFNYSVSIANNNIWRGVENTEKLSIFLNTSYDLGLFEVSSCYTTNYDLSYNEFDLFISKRFMDNCIKVSIYDFYTLTTEHSNIFCGDTHTTFFDILVDFDGEIPLEIEFSRVLYSKADRDIDGYKNDTDLFIFRYEVLKGIKLYTTVISNQSGLYMNNPDFMKYGGGMRFFNYGVKYTKKIKKMTYNFEYVYNDCEDKSYVMLSIEI